MGELSGAKTGDERGGLTAGINFEDPCVLWRYQVERLFEDTEFPVMGPEPQYYERLELHESSIPRHDVAVVKGKMLQHFQGQQGVSKRAVDSKRLDVQTAQLLIEPECRCKGGDPSFVQGVEDMHMRDCPVNPRQWSDKSASGAQCPGFDHLSVGSFRDPVESGCSSMDLA